MSEQLTTPVPLDVLMDRAHNLAQRYGQQLREDAEQGALLAMLEYQAAHPDAPIGHLVRRGRGGAVDAIREQACIFGGITDEQHRGYTKMRREVEEYMLAKRVSEDEAIKAVAQDRDNRDGLTIETYLMMAGHDSSGLDEATAAWAVDDAIEGTDDTVSEAVADLHLEGIEAQMVTAILTNEATTKAIPRGLWKRLADENGVSEAAIRQRWARLQNRLAERLQLELAA